MACRRSKALFLLFLLTPINAWKLSFYTDEESCAGEFLGSWAGGPDQGCQHGFVGTASGVVIEGTGETDYHTNNIAQFFSSSDCADGTMISEGNVGCVGIDGGFGSYKSFKIAHTPNNNHPIPSGAVTIPGTVTATSTGSVAARSLQASTTPSSISLTTGTPSPFSHGGIHHVDGTSYRMHQVHEGFYRGIPLNEWDENVHVKNVQLPLSVGNSVAAPQNLTTRVGALDERFIGGACKNIVTCSNRLVGGATSGAVALAGTISGYWDEVGTQASAAKLSVGDYMRDNPIYAQIIIGSTSSIPSGIALAWVGGKYFTTNQNAVATCSLNNTQLDGIVRALESHISTLREASAVTVTLWETVTDTISEITMSTVACGQLVEGDQCNLPTGTCIAPPGQGF